MPQSNFEQRFDSFLSFSVRTKHRRFETMRLDDDEVNLSPVPGLRRLITDYRMNLLTLTRGLSHRGA